MGSGGLEEDGVRIGRIVAAHSLDGGVKVHPSSDHVDQWGAHLRQVWVGGRCMAVRGQRVARGEPVLLLDGIRTRTDAEQLVGQNVLVAADDLPPLPSDEYYWHDLVGLAALDARGESLGRVTAIMRGAADALEIAGARGTALVPLVQAWVAIDAAAGRATIKAEPDWVPHAD